MNQTNNQKQVNGQLLEQTIAFLKEKKGEEAIAELEKTVGPLIFDQYRTYPVDQLINLQKETVKAVFGNETDEGYYALGQHAFNSFVHTLIGATLTNVSASPIEVLKKIQEIWNSVVNFGERKLEDVDETKGKAVIVITDDPRNPFYLQGVIEAGLAAIHANNPTTNIISRDTNNCSIAISWQV